MKRVLTALFTAFVLGIMPAQATQVGEKAPDFTLKAADGSEQSLSTFGGKIVVLEWYNKDCPFVRKHYDSDNMQGLQRAYAARGVVWLTINSSAPAKQGYQEAAEALATAKAESSAAAHVLLDPQGIVGKAYQAKTTPHMYVIGDTGTLVYAGGIDDKPSTDVADVPAARSYIREALDSVLDGKPVETAEAKPYGCAVKYEE